MTEIEIYKQIVQKYESLTHILSEMAKYSSCVTNNYMSNLRTIRKDEEKELALLLQQVEKCKDECEHPFASVHTRCFGEINKCLKCGKEL